MIPKVLISDIKSKKVLLFLGSGFAYHAEHPDKKSPPLGNQLATIIADQFLGEGYSTSPLTVVSDLAISETNLFEVQQFVKGIFEKFRPSSFHKIYPTLPWKAIFTTNYDLILERAYEAVGKDCAQEISVVFRNTPEHQIFRNSNVVPYYKLHGCITCINDQNVPLILSTEQYITHRQNRERLFKKFEELAQDFTVLFIGYSNQDVNMRTILKELETLKDAKPRSYMVGPHFSDHEIRYWEGRKITPIKLGHEEFIQKIDTEISKPERVLSKLLPAMDRTIYRKFQIDPKENIPSESLCELLDVESEFVHSSLPSQNTTASAFYKGYFQNWDPIIRNFDIERQIKDRIVADVALDERYQDPKASFTFIIKGFGGSGKSVLLKRVAWEMSVSFDKVCIFVKQNASLRVEPIIELANFVKERIYIFIDNVVENEHPIIQVLNRAAKDGFPITVISAERTNIWNGENRIRNYVSDEFNLTYLTPTEIDALIGKLSLHNSLGHLEKKNQEERRREFQEQAGRVLLVALYEATGGKPFEEIILDEYSKIVGDEAKSLYITVSVFHRLGVGVRAGLISRVHGISFQQFQDRLYKPLEFIVFDSRNHYSSDYEYRTRHPYIAQMVFEMVLKTEQDRYDEYVRILKFLDIDFESDRAAFVAMTNARKLLEIFNDPTRIRIIYKIAEETSPNDGKLIQQKAIFEMNSSNGNLIVAERLLNEAIEILPHDSTIVHSLVECLIRKGEHAKNELEKEKLFEYAQKLCEKNIKKNKDDHYGYHSLLKISISRFKGVLAKSDNVAVEKRMKDIDKLLSEARYNFPDQEFLLDIEAKYYEMIQNEPRALELLKHAYFVNNASPYISLRYAKMLEQSGNLQGAMDALKGTLDAQPNERDVNFRYAMMLQKFDPENLTDIILHLRRSFTLGDNRFDAQFWFARALYLKNEIEKASEVFKVLSMARVGPNSKKNPKGIVVDPKHEPTQFFGVVLRVDREFGFLKRDSHGDDIFFANSDDREFTKFQRGTKVSFNLAFNFRGPIAVNLKAKVSKER